MRLYVRQLTAKMRAVAAREKSAAKMRAADKRTEELDIRKSQGQALVQAMNLMQIMMERLAGPSGTETERKPAPD